MSTNNFFYQEVTNALIKDGWLISHNPLFIRLGDMDMSIEFGANQLIGAEKDNQKIAVEIQSFLGKSSAINEFHTALGQFINYRTALRQNEPERILYLAVPLITYNNFFKLKFPQLILQENQVKLIIYNPEIEVITQWKK